MRRKATPTSNVLHCQVASRRCHGNDGWTHQSNLKQNNRKRGKGNEQTFLTRDWHVQSALLCRFMINIIFVWMAWKRVCVGYYVLLLRRKTFSNNGLQKDTYVYMRIFLQTTRYVCMCVPLFAHKVHWIFLICFKKLKLPYKRTRWNIHVIHVYTYSIYSTIFN